MSGKTIPALLDEIDQDRIRADLAVFFGGRAEPYLRLYARMLAGSGARRTFPLSWSWPVFLGSFVWFFYRKMYAIGALMLGIPIVLGFLVDVDITGGMLAFAFFAKTLYVQSALRRICLADDRALAGEERRAYLRLAGGVSPIAGLIAGTVYACLVAVVLLGAFGVTDDLL
jgi:hypothetical protein